MGSAGKESVVTVMTMELIGSRGPFDISAWSPPARGGCTYLDEMLPDLGTVLEAILQQTLDLRYGTCLPLLLDWLHRLDSFFFPCGDQRLGRRLTLADDRVNQRI